MQENQMFRSYYAIIPASVRYNKDITPNAKLLYGEITALCNERGYCWANNDYFAKLYSVSKVSISKWINQLINGGYIVSEIIYKEGTKEILSRYLRIVNDPIKEKFNTPIKEKFNTPIKEKFKDNNTIINNTSINNINNNSRKSKNDFDESTIEYQLARFLFESIKQNDLNFKEPNLTKWACHIDKLIRLDKRTIEEIKSVIIFATSDSFWKANILSTGKLRQKFSTLLIQLQERGKGFGTDRKQDKQATTRDTRKLEEWQERQIETAKQFANREIEEVDF